MTHRPSSRIVVITPNWLGDALMSLPLIGLLRGAARVRLCLMCPPYTSRVYLGIEGVDDVIVLPKRGAARGLKLRSRILRRLRPDAAVVLPPSFSSALATAAARVPIRIGYGTDGRSFLLNRAIPSGRLRREHLSESYLRLGRKALECIGSGPDSSGAPLNSAGPSAEAAREAPKPAVFPDERSSLEGKLREAGAPTADFCLMVPGATYGSAKTWPPEAFRETARRLSPEMPVVLAGGNAEREVCTRIAEGEPHIFDLCGKTTLGEFFALVESAGVLVANDSGAAHAAASLGTPAVVVFGSTSPRWTAPVGGDTRIVRSPTLCSPCFRRACPTGLECFTAVRPEDVIGPALRLAAGSGKKKESLSSRTEGRIPR